MSGDLTAPSASSRSRKCRARLKEYAATSYLQEARQYLYDEEQYTLLSNYENSEYDAELDKLRRHRGRWNEALQTTPGMKRQLTRCMYSA